MAEDGRPEAVIGVVDVAAHAREIFGDKADLIAGRPMPETDWRFEATLPNGASVTFHRGATAEHVAAYLAREASGG